MSEAVHCPICGDEAKVTAEANDIAKVDCRECGIFHVAKDSIRVLGTLSQTDKAERLAEAKRRARPGSPPLIYEA